MSLGNEIVSYVSTSIDDMKRDSGLALPANYSAGNALNSALLILTDRTKGPSLFDKMTQGKITKTSVVQALQDMVIQGLSPAKNQGYFIQYGPQLAWQPSYFGSVTVVKRQSEVSGTPFANVVHKGDEFEIDTNEDGRIVVTKFKPDFTNQDKEIIAAYAVINFKDGHKEYTVMTKKEINQAWSHRSNHGKVQQEFPQEMAKRTVLQRAAKFIINTSDDNDLMIESVNRTEAQANDYEDQDRKDVTPDKTKLENLMADEEDSDKKEVKDDQKSDQEEVSVDGSDNQQEDEPEEDQTEGQAEQSELL